MARKPMKEQSEIKKEIKRKRKVNKDNETKEVIDSEVVERKEKKTLYSIWDVVLLALLCLIFGLLLGSFIVYNKYKAKYESSNIGEIKYVYESLLDDYYGEVDEDTLLNGAIAGMIYSLNDSYALFLKPQEAIEFNHELNGNYVGLGVTVKASEDGNIEVILVNEGSPADKGGIEVGDIISKVDGVEYDANNLDKMVYNIQTSKEGTKTKIEVIREGETKVLEVTLEKIELTSVESTIVESPEDSNKKVGVITISTFSSNTYGQFLEEYKKLEKEGINALVIDVRNNGGGYLSSANQIASLFLDKGAVLYKKTDRKSVEETKCETNKKIDLPLVLVVNAGTASSSEVFVASLKENINVDIVGTKTYGKGTVQKYVPLINGAYIKYTVLEWLTPNGNNIDGIGIQPNIEVKIDENSCEDLQLKEAIQVAMEKMG